MAKPRSGSTADALNMMVEAAKPLVKPPAHIKLTKEEQPFWKAIIECKPPNDWSDSDYILIGQLAKVHRLINIEHDKLVKEGMILNGKANPRIRVVNQLTARQGVLMRSLRLAGVPQGMTGMSARQDVQRNRAFRSAKRAQAQVGAEGEDLLA